MQKEGEDHPGGLWQKAYKNYGFRLTCTTCTMDSWVCPHHQHHCHLHTCNHLELLSENELLVSHMESIWIFQTDKQDHTLLIQMNLCVVTCITNSIMDTDLAACDTYRNAQSDQERPGHLD